MISFHPSLPGSEQPCGMHRQYALSSYNYFTEKEPMGFDRVRWMKFELTALASKITLLVGEKFTDNFSVRWECCDCTQSLS